MTRTDPAAMPAPLEPLLPYQAEWVKDSSPIKIAEKSRRIGLSWSTAAECVLEAAKASGQDCWYVGYNKDMALEFIRDCAWWARTMQLVFDDHGATLIKDEDNDILAFVVRFASGYRITALSSRPANLRGKQGYVVIDEAAFHDDLAGLLKAAVAMLMWGGRVAIISTHNGVDSEFNELVLKTRSGEKDYSLHSVTLDDALRQDFYWRICQMKETSWMLDNEIQWRQDLIDHYGIDADEELFCVPRKLTSGDFFKRDHFNLIDQAPTDLVAVVRGHDLAATERSKRNRDPDWTRSVKMGKTDKRRLVIMHGCGLQGSPGMVDAHLQKVAKGDGKEVTQLYWQDPGQAGKHQRTYLGKLLQGYHTSFKVATKDKATYAGPLSSQALAGNVDVVKGDWNESFFNELESFPPPTNKGHDDWVDAASRCEIGLRGRGGGSPLVVGGGREVMFP